MNISERHLDSLIIVISEIIRLWKNSELIKGMDDAVQKYIERYLPYLKKLRMYYPDHKVLDIGMPTDQFMAFMMQLERNIQNKYIKLEDSELFLIQSAKTIIVYGAGTVAAELIEVLKEFNISVFAIAVTDKEANKENMAGITIYQIDELIEYKDEALGFENIVIPHSIRNLDQ